MSRVLAFAIVLISVMGFAMSAAAHFGAVIPSSEVVEQGGTREVGLSVMFLHPMQLTYMKMERPPVFGVMARGKKTDLTATLKRESRGDANIWKTSYKLKRPGDHLFYLQPAPYWEEAEESFIIHYTKVAVNGFGLETGWREPVGFAVEIMPLTRPYGLWAGNLFTGQVLQDGKPLAGCEVEIEYLNTDGVAIPAGPFETQVVTADERGIFSYAMPRAGWWGFAALTTADRKLKKDGVEKPVELGGVIWVRAREMK